MNEEKNKHQIFLGKNVRPIYFTSEMCILFVLCDQIETTLNPILITHSHKDTQ
jgi:hypothetical protein